MSDVFFSKHPVLHVWIMHTTYIREGPIIFLFCFYLVSDALHATSPSVFPLYYTTLYGKNKKRKKYYDTGFLQKANMLLKFTA